MMTTTTVAVTTTTMNVMMLVMRRKVEVLPLLTPPRNRQPQLLLLLVLVAQTHLPSPCPVILHFHTPHRRRATFHWSSSGITLLPSSRTLPLADPLAAQEARVLRDIKLPGVVPIRYWYRLLEERERERESQMVAVHFTPLPGRLILNLAF